MRRLLIIAAAALALTGAAPAPDVPRDELLAFADKFDAAQITKDGEALEDMLTDDFVFIEGSGKRSDKAAFIAGWTGPDETYEPITIVDRVVVPLGPDAGIVGGEVVLKGTSAGKAFAVPIRFSDTFRRVGGKWRAVHIQVTRLP